MALGSVGIVLGYNSITFRSKSGTNDLSKPSQPIVVHFDEEVQVSPSRVLASSVDSDRPIRH